MISDTIAEDTLILAQNTAEIAAREAGKYLKEKRGKAEVVRKKALRDYLLDADLIAERIIINKLQENFPNYEILSEETQEEYKVSPYKWVVDPLDGSANFQHGSPVFAVSISLLINAVTTIGVTYLPVLDEIFTALLGHGALLNGQPISVSNISNLDDAMVYVGDFSKDGNRDENEERIVNVARLANAVGRVRMIGTAATDLAYVACGRADALIVHNPSPWDIEVGHLLINEAGGKVTRHNDEVGGNLVICSNGMIHEELMKSVFTGRPVLDWS